MSWALKTGMIVVAVVASVQLADARGRSRPFYGGGHHTYSHGGKFFGGRGSSHKGGKYHNPRSGHRYGKHK
nr:MAG TPA: hypothetical protein [Caudoviricetes sp.]